MSESYKNYHSKYCLFLAKRNCQVNGEPRLSRQYLFKAISTNLTVIVRLSWMKNISIVLLDVAANTVRQSIKNYFQSRVRTNKNIIEPSTTEVNHV